MTTAPTRAVASKAAPAAVNRPRAFDGKSGISHKDASVPENTAKSNSRANLIGRSVVGHLEAGAGCMERLRRLDPRQASAARASA
jgi:hypothetical protein